jgi:UDP-2-acetamido-3-amino-2,3-dideoxy-glucuronate N-acetyltransferase
MFKYLSKFFAALDRMTTFNKPKNYFAHASSCIEDGAHIGAETKIWHFAQIRPGAQIGERCIIGKSVFIDAKVKIGNNVKIQNFATLYQGLSVEDGVYIGPSVTFTNDKMPRAINPDGTQKSLYDWTLLFTVIKKGASIGANATILPGITIGEFAMVGAGAVVTKNVPNGTVVVGNPARVVGRVDAEGSVVLDKDRAVELEKSKLKVA